MKKTVLMILTALALGIAFVACSDDSESACDKLANQSADAIDSVCADYPDCSMCTVDTQTDGSTEGATEEACQSALDTWDAEAATAGYKTVCDLEASMGAM